MENKKFLLIAALTLITASATAQTNLSETLESFDNRKIQQEINNRSDEVPGIVESVFGNQKANIHIEGELNRSYRLKTSGARVENFSQGSWENPTLEVWTNTSTVEEIINSETPSQKLKQKLENDEIRYREKGLLNKLRFAVVNLFL